MSSYFQDYAVWAKINEWTLEQAALLTVGVFPLDPETSEQVTVPTEKERRYNRTLGLLRYDFDNGHIQKSAHSESKVEAATYVFWCKAKKPRITLPPELKKFVMQNYKFSNADVIRRMHGKKYITALKILHVLVKEKYGHWITEGKNTELTGKIHAAFTRAGITVDEATILDRLRDADKVVRDYRVKNPASASREFE